MTGVTFPVAISSRRMVRSSLFDLAINVTNFWLTNQDHTSAVIQPARIPMVDPLGPPTAMYIPFGFKTRLQADKEWFAKQSKKMS